MKLPPFTLSFIYSLILLLASIVSQPAAAALSLQLSTETHGVAQQAGAKTPPDVQEDLEVILADDYLSVKSAKKVLIFDFKTRHRIQIDLASKAYVEYSLYDVVGFRTFEFKNREVMRQMLAAAKLSGSSATTIENEHLLSISSGVSAKIDETQSVDEFIFSSGDHPLLRSSKKSTAVSSADAQHFVRFLRYHLGGHPQILAKLAAGAAIPDKLALSFTEIGVNSTHTLTIKALHEVNVPSYSLNNYTRRNSVAGDPLDGILDRAVVSTKTDQDAAILHNQADMENALRNGKFLDAVLGSIEFNLMTGQQSLPFPPEKLQAIRADTNVQKFLGAVGANSKETMMEAVKILPALRAQAPDKAYLLKLFEANDRARLGEKIAARQLFIDVLQANPQLAGAYVDLGELLASEYDTFRAWRSWDIGRRLNPKFPGLANVNKLESELPINYPEYF